MGASAGQIHGERGVTLFVQLLVGKQGVVAEHGDGAVAIPVAQQRAAVAADAAGTRVGERVLGAQVCLNRTGLPGLP
ncbi:Uncharacterised protein [Mycobacteroides abscessus subsp. abscessus]|nr:Uncharacterised protein [Mycobacteroides abscessus subsp. abscessus]